MQADPFFKYRRIGRCPSPPTWGCYELATSSRSTSPSGSDCSSDDSNSEEEDDDISVISEDEVQQISAAEADQAEHKEQDSDDQEMRDSEADPNLVEEELAQVQNLVRVETVETVEPKEPQETLLPPSADPPAKLPEDQVEFDPLPYALHPPSPESFPPSQPSNTLSPPEPEQPAHPEDEDAENQRLKRQDKGKGREIIPDPIPIPSSSTSTDDASSRSPESTRKPSKRRNRDRHGRASSTYRPILTIRASHGWIWNQDLFIPNYLKDRYLSSATQASSSNYSSRISLSQTNFTGMDFEVECVEIRVSDQDLMEIIPS